MSDVATPATVGILGGMGPAAGADFVRRFVGACERVLTAHGSAINDQAFQEHWLIQLPVPDRTQALLEGGVDPLEGMSRGLRLLQSVGVRSVAIACNTAHAWHAKLQQRCPEVLLLNIVEQTTSFLKGTGVGRVGLMATHRTRLYENAFEHAGIECQVPTPGEQVQVMTAIRDGEGRPTSTGTLTA